MKINRYFILINVAFFILLNSSLIGVQKSTAQEPATSEPEVLWLWGEVISVDTQNKALLVKYLDYETDTEKEISITVDDKTTYENISSLDELKPQDTIGIDYVVSPEAKFIAKNISVERPEENAGVQEENAPEEKPIEPLPEVEE